ncbi:DNA polymerase III subunit delta [Mycoplasmoides pirum]|uniref:DNA polymerase III subunit delta n=1 Tax=Mycoplasmoides pirum TaxID=2122 RepID=UPI00047F7E77|nr:hypothetical protein [Mycoplasmoides pirum]
MTIIYSTDEGLINYKLKEILKEKYSTYKKIIYKSPNQLIDLLHANNMFDESNEKLYIVKGCDFLIDENSLKIAYDLISALKLNTKLDVYLTVESNKLLNKDKSLNEFLNLVKIIEIPKLNLKTFKNIIINFLDKNKINLTFDQINLLLSRIPQNAKILENELNKFLLFPPNEISNELLNNLITEYENDSIFKLVEYILTQKINEAILLFDSLILHQYTSLEILQIMASQVLKIIMIKLAIDNKLNDELIIKDLEISFFQLNQIKKISSLLSIKHLENFLNGILSIDVMMKRLNMDYNVLRFFICKGKY